MDEALNAVVQKELDSKPGGAHTHQVAVNVLSSGQHRATIWSRAGAARTFQPNSRYLLYSISKTIYAAALLKFVAAGRIRLDDTLEKWLPEFPLAARCTLRFVLMHVSGLPDYGALETYHADVRSGAPPWSEAEFLLRTGADELLFEPGTDFRYSNIGYMLLRRVLIRIGASDLETVLKRAVLDPLGVTSASVPIHKTDLRDFAFGVSRYLANGGAPVDVPEHYDPRWISTGVVGMSIEDLARTIDGIFKDLLPAPLRDQMTQSTARFHQPLPNRPWRAPAYGLGVAIDRDTAHGPAYGHLGGGPGCSPAAYFFPQLNSGTTIAVISDGEDTLPEDIILAIAGEVGCRKI
jgi:D-alanyl-D-alanine carboxypeptidase